MAFVNLVEEAEADKEKYGEIESIDKNSTVLLRQIQPHLDTLKSDAEEYLKDENLSVMNVHEYIDKFLLLHMGFVDESSSYNNDMWYEFAGGPYRPVNLVDSTGEVVVQVPSIFPKEIIHHGTAEEARETIQNEMGQETLGKKINAIRHYGENYRVQAQNRLDGLYASLVSKISKEAIEEHKKKWEDFFEKMGVFKVTPEMIEGKVSVETVTESTSQNQVNNPEVEFIFDDE